MAGETNGLWQEVIGETRDLSDKLQTQGGIIKHAEMAKHATEQNYRAVLEIHRHREAQLQEYATGKIVSSEARVPHSLTNCSGCELRRRQIPPWYVGCSCRSRGLRYHDGHVL